MNSKLVASTCDKARGVYAYGRSLLSTILVGRAMGLKAVSYQVKAVLTLLVLAFLTIPTTAQTDCQLSCDDQKNISIGTAGYSTIFPELVLNGDFSCALPVIVDVQDEAGVSFGNRIDCDAVGKTLTVKVTGANNENCWSSIKVEDKLANSLQCEDIYIACTTNTLPDTIGFPSLQDNCGTVELADLQYFDLYTDLPCGTFEEGRELVGRITRSWTIVDQYNNVGFCTQNINLLKGFINTVVFPGDCDGVTNATLSCDADPDDLTLAGMPTIHGFPLETADFCKFYVNYQDQTADICPPSSYRILRRWEVIDLCTKETKVHIQNIILADNEKPDLTCPDSLSVSANDLDCSAAIILPQANADDNCSNVIITPTWEFGIGYGPFTNIPSGTHTVTYTAVDECGNTSTCTTELAIIDNIKPVAVCRDQVHIALSTGGSSTVAATIFDGGSRDNCGIASIYAKRDSIYAPYLTFSCEDLGEIQEVVLQITDEAGLYTECNSQLIIDDEILPTVICPATATIDCKADYEDTSITGEATAMDDCSIKSLRFDDVLEFNSCATSGKVVRNWFAEDLAGNIGSCTQIINVLDNTPLEIAFPEEYTTYQCGSDISPAVTGEPILTGDDCESTFISHADERVDVGEGACYQILRKWRIIDWCEFNDVNDEDAGVYTYTQVINVLDWEDPIITFCPEDITVDLNESDCYTSVALPLIIAEDCTPLLFYSNNSPYADIPKEDASGKYPSGTTTVTYTVQDGCGNSASCESTITVLDKQAPTPVCKHSISIALRTDGTVLVPENAINSGSYDNCDNSETLSYNIEPNYFTCDDIGKQTINLIVTDGSGNSDFCTTDIFIQDNNDTCNPESFSTIGGKITTESGAAMQEVAVSISGGMSEKSYTNTNGEYLFEALVPSSSYQIEPVTGELAQIGVSTFDIVLIQKHILGIATLDSPYKLIASDVNNSGSITTFDVVQLRQLILGVIDHFPNNNSWRYIPSDYTFVNPENPYAESFPESITYEQLTGSNLEKNFIAIKIGDVNESASPDAMVGTARSTATPFELFIENKALIKGERYEIPVTATNLASIIGLQFALSFDTDILQLEEILPHQNNGFTLNHFGLQHLNRGHLLVSWDQIKTTTDNTLFTLIFTAKQNASLQQLININTAYLSSEAYSQKEELLPLALRFNNAMARLYQNQPNPFENITTIGFSLPDATTGTLSIHDINGRLLKSFTQPFLKGHNELQIDISDLSIQSGVLYYQLTSPITQRLSKKMIVIE